MKKIVLSDSQQQIFEKIQQFLVNKEQNVTICGYAGTGKTTLTKYIVTYAKGTLKMNVVGVAPTHKARKVLDKVLNANSFMMTNTLTVAGLLSKLKAHSYIGTKRYVSDGNHKLNMFDLFVIDEVSMISDIDYDEIVTIAQTLNKKVIFIGDNAQIPHPTQPMILENGELIKPDSKAFSVSNLLKLDQIIRQASDNPILEYSAYYRNNLGGPVSFDKITKINSSGDGVIFVKQPDFINKIKETFAKNTTQSKVIVYTNNAVKTYNKIIRIALDRKSDFVIGELLMGYVNSEWIENGQDYTVIDITATAKHTIHLKDVVFSELKGQIIGLKDNDLHVEKHVFIPDVYDDSNLGVLNELIVRAEKVNQAGSTKKDYKNYMDLKNQLTFMSDIYRYDGKIMNDNEFNASHPLLFTQISDVITDNMPSMTNDMPSMTNDMPSMTNRVVNNTSLTQQIKAKYPKLIEQRVSDNKVIADSEVFADKYKIIDKDIDYGYAITAHKSQASTYITVFVDETDFDKIRNRWNFKLKHNENRTKERNQLLYVAYTRCSHLLYVKII